MVALALSVSSLFLGRHLKVHIAQELANPIVTILAINTGFLATIISLMLTIPSKHSFLQMRSADYWEVVVNYHWHGIVAGFIAAILSLCVLIICKDFTYLYQDVFFFLWVASVGWAFTAFIRAGVVLKSLL